MPDRVNRGYGRRKRRYGSRPDRYPPESPRRRDNQGPWLSHILESVPVPILACKHKVVRGTPSRKTGREGVTVCSGEVRFQFHRDGSSEDMGVPSPVS